jgi:predicted nucleotide-binding protein
MSDKAIERAEQLIEEGNDFTYENFSVKSLNGYPTALTTDYITWKTKVEVFISSTFGKSSPIFELFIKTEKIAFIGNGPDQFEKLQSTIIGALRVSIDTLNFEPLSEQPTSKDIDTTSNGKVFIVHGHDELMKNQLEIFLSELGLEPVVLHRKADEGLTVIEKFEKHSDVGYAFILLTPDDIGYPTSEESKADAARSKEQRARQNVIFEFGYFVAKLGRNRVCCLYKEGVMLPTDVSGIIYKKVLNAVEEAAFSILKDLKAVGYKVAV